MDSTVIEVSAYGSPFSHDQGSCFHVYPTRFKWVYDAPADSGIEFSLDYDMFHGVESKAPHKFLWLCESRGITPIQRQKLINHKDLLLDTYKAIFVHDNDLIREEPRFSFGPPAANCTWVLDRGIHPKTKNISMVSSGKSFCTGHQYRNRWMEYLKLNDFNIDYYGRNFNPFEAKEDVLRDYHFSVTIENESYSDYWTEKLMDCFACGTIPVYHGTPDIKDRFNMNGVILLDESVNFQMLTRDLYESKRAAIEENYERCLTERPADEIIFDKVLELI